MCKIMTNNWDELENIFRGKHGLKYNGPDLDAMKAISKAHKNRSLVEFDLAIQ